jgi:hypothetical protein
METMNNKSMNGSINQTPNQLNELNQPNELNQLNQPNELK